MKHHNPDEVHKALINLLKSSPYTRDLSMKKRNTISSVDLQKLDTNDINSGVRLLVHFWNLSGGSVGNFNLYSLLQKYIEDESARDEINKLL